MDKLRDLLAANNWQAADTETAHLIFEDFEKFSSEDLHAIDRLWIEFSNGDFGFSVQNKIYQQIALKPEYDYTQRWQKFGEIVGWRVHREWIHQHCTFDLQAPVGHLPVLGRIELSNDDWPSDRWYGWSSGSRAWYSQVTDWHVVNIEDESHRRFSYLMSKFTNQNIP